MASITFFLKEPWQAQPTLIIARVSVASAKIKVYTGLRVEPRKWLQASQLVQTRGNTQAGRLNDTLAAQRAQPEAYLLDALAAGRVPTPEQLRQVLDPAPVAEVSPVAVAPPVLSPSRPGAAPREAAPVGDAPAEPEPVNNIPAVPAAPNLLTACVAWDQDCKSINYIGIWIIFCRVGGVW